MGEITVTRNARGTNQTKKQGGGSNAMDANWARAWLRVRECGCAECWSWAHVRSRWINAGSGSI